MALDPRDLVRFMVGPFGQTVKDICFFTGKHVVRLANPVSGCFAVRDVSSYIDTQCQNSLVHQDFTKYHSILFMPFLYQLLIGILL